MSSAKMTFALPEAKKAVAFYQEVMGAELLSLSHYPRPSSEAGVKVKWTYTALLRIGASEVVISDDSGLTDSTSSCWLDVPEFNDFVDNACARGCRRLGPVKEDPHSVGVQVQSLEDPFGVKWSIRTTSDGFMSQMGDVNILLVTGNSPFKKSAQKIIAQYPGIPRAHWQSAKTEKSANVYINGNFDCIVVDKKSLPLVPNKLWDFVKQDSVTAVVVGTGPVVANAALELEFYRGDELDNLIYYQILRAVMKKMSRGQGQ